MVQSRLLYSIPLFWHGYRADSKREMDIAIRLALDLGMFRRKFAAEQGEDPVIKESWRRTWWMVFIIDAYYAGTLGAMNFATIHVETTVELPCEEAEYESGEIPEPRTLAEFDCREFADDNTSFSSFAYLITAVRCAALAISIAPKIAVKEASPQVIESADSIVDAWLLLLPKNEKQVMSKTGEIDELMFQAHLVIHVATIGLHRPLSDLRFNTVEGVSSCARDPPAEIPTPDLINIHTTRVLRSVEAQIRLLALPARPFKHTPFTTCMVSEGTLALLSACNFLLKGKELAIARDQIRMTIGCLKSLGEVWPRTARNVREIQTIARHVLGLGSKTDNSSTPRSNQVPSLAGSEGQETLSSDNGLSSSEVDVFSSLSTLDSVCGWHNLNDLPLDLSWWTEEG
ncbi:C6 transcription factor [Fusarium albosuccineum]|uniref:C6 transcription factor n=1 Tax=Fusarium albosuccineum TaxID=1237068 RepID=A0A8H4LG74_9HYPO|nr:C6 transcription factor [Fusarium albosuccineum]